MSKRSLSSFTGNIDEIPQISVDNFEDHSKRAYFLSHCHTDHTHGLFNTEFIDSLERNNSFVYMSQASGGIIKYESTDHRLDRFIRPLSMGRTTIKLSEDNTHETLLNVTLLPAGHCFGSVMFLFTINHKNILYSGDFRIHSNDISKYAHLHKNGEVISLNTLYIDTTFQNVTYENFPKRMDSIQYVIDAIKKWLSLSEKHRVALHTSAKYGYECVCNEIYRNLGLKVYVNGSKWELYRNFISLIPGVTNDESKIHLCSNRSENRSHETCSANISGTKFLYIHLSAMIWSEYIDELPFFQRFGDRLNVCFATHCSRSELVYFIEYLNPKRVVGFPEPFAEKLKVTDQFKVTPKKRKMAPKNCSEAKKVNMELLKEMFEI